MVMKKDKPRFYILPGWGHRITDESYKKLISFAIAKGYEVPSLRISTRDRKYSLGSAKSLGEIIQKIEKQIARPCSEDTILGFSIGALQTYLVAQHLTMKHVILCSMSPILGADLQSYSKKEVRDLSPTQYKEMSRVDYSPLATLKVTLLYGEKESDVLKKRSIQLGGRKGFTSIEVKGADHELNRTYLNAIKEIL